MEDFAKIDPSTSSSEVAKEALYGGYTRFELELEFVQSLANPYYLNHLASQKLLQDHSFIAYLKYLQYFTKPEYTKFLLYPGPTLKALELLQQQRFRLDILSPDAVERLVQSDLLAIVGER
ncbi:hypothetical protein MMC31_001181 [Peltigera leucophlebia]|nr:hypothetical protein [Peltigera leucophlebia]